MFITILPVTQELKRVVQKHGADGWTVLMNSPRCKERNNQPATLVSKNNSNCWLIDNEMKIR